MSRLRPSPECRDVAFARAYAVSPAAEVALEDYARVLTRAAAAEAVPAGDDPGRLGGVHLCAPELAPEGGLGEDIEAFARELAEQAGDGLGWS